MDEDLRYQGDRESAQAQMKNANIRKRPYQIVDMHVKCIGTKVIHHHHFKKERTILKIIGK